jgi:hypothetical protein
MPKNWESSGFSAVPNLSMEISVKTHDVIVAVKVHETDDKKGPAVGYLLHLARHKPDHLPRDFGPVGKASANYGMDKPEWAAFAAFRTHFSPALDTRGEFFAAALPIGCTLYQDGYRLEFPGGSRDFLQSTLLPPQQ